MPCRILYWDYRVSFSQPRTQITFHGPTMTFGCYLSTWEVEAGGSEVQGDLWLHSEFEAKPGLLKTLFQKNQTRDGKARLKAGAAFAEYLGLLPSTPMEAHNHLNSSSRGLMPSSGFSWRCIHVVHTHIHKSTQYRKHKEESEEWAILFIEKALIFSCLPDRLSLLFPPPLSSSL